MTDLARHRSNPPRRAAHVSRAWGARGAQLSYGNGRTQSRAYDPNYWVDAISGSGADSLALNANLDDVGNILQFLGSGAAGNNYAYDGLYRLIQANSLTATPVYAFTYDATGNRLSKKPGTAATQSYVYPGTNHRLSSVAGTARTYDANGNTTLAASNKIWTYDARNRVVDFRTGSASSKIVSQYQYNARGERVRKYKSSTTQARYVYNESGQLLVEQTISGSTTTTSEIVWMDNLPVGLIRNNVLHYIEPDHLGTPRQVIDRVRNVAIWRWDLINDPFGESAPNTNPDADGAQFVFNMRFPGQLFDAESGLNYNYFRDYEAATGRYVESDPIGLDAGMSTYAYGGSAPILNIDPEGLELWCACEDKSMGSMGPHCCGPKGPLKRPRIFPCSFSACVAIADRIFVNCRVACVNLCDWIPGSNGKRQCYKRCNLGCLAAYVLQLSYCCGCEAD